MNIVAIPDAPIDKDSKLIPYQVKAGFTNSLLDLAAFCPAYVLERREELKKNAVEDKRIEVAFAPDKLGEIVKTYLRQCSRLHMNHTIARAPALMADTLREDLYEVIYNLAMESIRIGAQAGCRYIMIEPLIRNQEMDRNREKNIDFYSAFADIARKNHIMILVRNQYRNFHGNYVRCGLSEATKLKDFVDELNEKAGGSCFGICMDIGVCNICGQNMYEFAVTLGNEIKAVVVRENDGLHDTALIPFSLGGRRMPALDWSFVIRGLRAIDYDGELICDYRDSVTMHSHLLRQSVINYAKSNIDFLAWQISMERRIKKYSRRVMFGAGNMFSNYMKYYGTEYPPLFTCDNNSSLWGTRAAGIEVRNPEELKNISEDCAIFICNIYYREIEEQLRKMGIANRIEYYNDEYLPYDISVK